MNLGAELPQAASIAAVHESALRVLELRCRLVRFCRLRQLHIVPCGLV